MARHALFVDLLAGDRIAAAGGILSMRAAADRQKQTGQNEGYVSSNHEHLTLDPLKRLFHCIYTTSINFKCQISQVAQK
jgi:hypothetical protein